MAVGDAYGAKEWREGQGEDEVVLATMRIERRVCRAVAEFSFRHAERTRAKVSAARSTWVSPLYEGMLKEEMDAAAGRHPDVPYEPQLIDATFALLTASCWRRARHPRHSTATGTSCPTWSCPCSGRSPGRNRCSSRSTTTTRRGSIMAEAAHGTAPTLLGKNVANPLAMILAVGRAPEPHDDGGARRRTAVREAFLEAGRGRRAHRRPRGHASTTEFTDEVISRVRSKLEVWATIGDV